MNYVTKRLDVVNCSDKYISGTTYKGQCKQCPYHMDVRCPHRR